MCKEVDDDATKQQVEETPRFTRPPPPWSSPESPPPDQTHPPYVVTQLEGDDPAPSVSEHFSSDSVSLPSAFDDAKSGSVDYEIDNLPIEFKQD